MDFEKVAEYRFTVKVMERVLQEVASAACYADAPDPEALVEHIRRLEEDARKWRAIPDITGLLGSLKRLEIEMAQRAERLTDAPTERQP